MKIGDCWFLLNFCFVSTFSVRFGINTLFVSVCSVFYIYLSVKHLWDFRPEDWPDDVPLKDPNNASKDGT